MLGTNPYPFTRLVNAVIGWAEKNEEHIIVQSGNTPVESSKVEVHSFIEHNKIIELISKAEVVITQGGFGSLQDCMQQNARTIAVPRLISMSECQDDQTEIVKALADEKRVIPLHNVDELDVAIKSAKSMQIKSENNSQLAVHVSQTINTILGKTNEA